MAERKINSSFFNVNKLSGDTNFSDGSDLLANQGFRIMIQHVPSGRTIYFKAFIEAYNETFSPDWSEETVYGRMDPIYQFKNTTRNLTVGLAIPAASKSEAFENLAKLQALTQFLYPNYTQAGSATTIAQSPLLRLNVMNLAKSQKSWAPKLTHYVPDPKNPGSWILQEQPGKEYSAEDQGMKFRSVGGGKGADGLLGVLKSLTISHNLEGDKGVIETAPSQNPIDDGGILPKLINSSFDFGVIHEHHLGWDDQGNFSNNAFPYGLDFQASAPGLPPSPAVPANTAAQSAQQQGTPAGTPDALEPPSEDPRDPVDQAAANAQAQVAEALPPASVYTYGPGSLTVAGHGATGVMVDNVLERRGGESDSAYERRDSAIRENAAALERFGIGGTR